MIARERLLLICILAAAGGAAANMARPPLPDMPRIDPAELAPLTSVTPAPMPSASAPAPQPRSERTRIIDLSAVGHGPARVALDSYQMARLASWTEYPREALLPYISGTHAVVREIPCGSVGAHWVGGTTQHILGAAMYTGGTTVDSGRLTVSDISTPGTVTVETGGALCVRPSEGCVQSTLYECTFSEATTLCPDGNDISYSCGNAPASAPSGDCRYDTGTTDSDGDKIYDTETVTCTLARSEIPADGAWDLSGADTLRWVVAGLPSVLLVDGELALGGAALTVEGTVPAGAVLLRASSITGTPGTLTAPAGRQIVVDAGAGVIRVEAL
jgi:hypothetical protein